MPKQVSPAAVGALKEALCAVYWYKADLRSFLQQCLSNPAILATLNGLNYKRQIVSDLLHYLTRNQEKHLGDLRRLSYAICNITSFRHLEQLDGGAQKADRARDALAHLKGLVEPHQQAKKEQDDLVERQKVSAEKLKANTAVRQRLGDIKAKYTTLV